VKFDPDFGFRSIFELDVTDQMTGELTPSILSKPLIGVKVIPEITELPLLTGRWYGY
jgi:hypothetical protein